ncbi:hypothetical protein EMPG_12714 [Blastomyces silverae]|uniref:Uncharacterized protein n=1 Tax=Blastomyces silverae TaxID=2060906 RepID=A0A0H1BKZ6_9EURO|nr:hypothetical protein EMPG_12714 [Blastomyces silverae]
MARATLGNPREDNTVVYRIKERSDFEAYKPDQGHLAATGPLYNDPSPQEQEDAEGYSVF